MRNQLPSLAPREDAYNVIFHVNDFGKLSPAYCETDEVQADQSSIIEAIISGQYSSPVRIVAFNTHESWSRDATQDIALKILDLTRQGRVVAGVCRTRDR